MLSSKVNHTAVSISNKLFMIGDSFDQFDNFEVFDIVTCKFISIKSIPKWVKYLDPNKTFCIGYNIYCFILGENNEVKVHSYDIKNNVFSFKP